MAQFSYADEFAAFGEDLMGRVYPQGDYVMKVKTAKAAQTNGGKECFRLNVAFTSGPFKGKEIFEQMTWSPESEGAVKIFVQGLTNLGITQGWIKEAKPSPDQIAARMVGTMVEVSLSEDEYPKGTPVNRVKFKRFISRPGAGQGAESLGLAPDEPAAAAAAADEGEDLVAEDLAVGEDSLWN